MKKLLKIVAALVLVLVVAVIAFALYLDTLVKRGVERGGTHALGVETTLESASLRPLRGSCEIAGLTIANPPGYDAERFFGLGDARVDVTLATLRDDTLELPLLALNGIEINLQKKEGKANYEVILDNLRRFETGGPTTEEQTEGKTFIIREVVITDIKAKVDLLPAGGKLSTITIPVDEIRLKDVGSGGEPVATSELISIIIKAIFASVAANPQLPGEIAEGINQRMAQLEAYRAQGEEVARQVDETRRKIEETGKAIDEAAKGLGNLFGGEKDKK